MVYASPFVPSGPVDDVAGDLWPGQCSRGNANSYHQTKRSGRPNPSPGCDCDPSACAQARLTLPCVRHLHTAPPTFMLLCCSVTSPSYNRNAYSKCICCDLDLGPTNQLTEDTKTTLKKQKKIEKKKTDKTFDNNIRAIVAFFFLYLGSICFGLQFLYFCCLELLVFRDVAENKQTMIQLPCWSKYEIQGLKYSFACVYLCVCFFFFFFFFFFSLF